jgi:hypothetical protein
VELDAYSLREEKKKTSRDYTMASNADNLDIAAIFSEIVETVSHYLLETIGDVQDWLATPKIKRWLRIIVIVAAYLMLRPYIEMFFKKMFEKQMDKEDAERKKKREEEEGFLAPGTERAKKNANSLRVGGGAAEDEKENEGSDEEDEAEKIKASGVMDWGRGARKRQKAAAKQEALRKAEQMDEEELLQLLDWSESEGEGEKKKAAA